jgi:hypothetical protein
LLELRARIVKRVNLNRQLLANRVVFVYISVRDSVNSIGAESMLERQRFLFRRTNDRAQTPYVYEVLDPDNEHRAGIVRKGRSQAAGLFQRLLYLVWMPARFEVCETEDESLIFTINRSRGLLGPTIEVADADDHLVGYLKAGFRGDLWIYGWDGDAFGRIRRKLEKGEISIVRPDSVELGEVTDGCPGDSSFILSVDEKIADEPFAKMLILGAILGMDLL